MRSALKSLPKTKRGLPIPWFVTMTKPDGEPDFINLHPMRAMEAVVLAKCWICGGKLTSKRSFVCGPLSIATRHVAEPPMHLDCARFAVTTCPFMCHPTYQRKEPHEDKHSMPGLMIDRNPGVNLICTTANFKVTINLEGPLFQLGRDMRLECYREGRPATRAEYLTSLEEGADIIRKRIEADPDANKDQWELFRQIFDEARDVTLFNEAPPVA